MNLAPEIPSTGFCPFAQITGNPCVLCGGSRALIALFQGDIGRALEMNSSMLLFALIFISYIFFESVTGNFRTLSYLLKPRELIERSAQFLTFHKRGTLIFGFLWWFWNIQRWS